MVEKIVHPENREPLDLVDLMQPAIILSFWTVFPGEFLENIMDGFRLFCLNSVIEKDEQV